MFEEKLDALLRIPHPVFERSRKKKRAEEMVPTESKSRNSKSRASLQKRGRGRYPSSTEPDSGRQYRVCQCGLHILRKVGKSSTNSWIAFSNHAGTNYKECDKGGFKNSVEKRKKVEISFRFLKNCFEAARNPLVFVDFASMKTYCRANPAPEKKGNLNAPEVSVSSKAAKRDPPKLFAGVELPLKVFSFICI